MLSPIGNSWVYQFHGCYKGNFENKRAWGTKDFGTRGVPTKLFGEKNPLGQEICISAIGTHGRMCPVSGRILSGICAPK